MLVTLLYATANATADEPRPAPVAPPRCRPFELGDVRLLDGPFKRSQDTHATYLLSLEPDRLLSRFLVETGLPPKSLCYPDWEQKELPGVGASFYLSGCADVCGDGGPAIPPACELRGR